MSEQFHIEKIGDSVYIGGNGRTVCRMYGDNALNDAQTILRAVNSFEAQAQAIEMLRKSITGLVYPQVPSGDDLMLLACAGGITQAQQEAFRPTCERVKTAQTVGRAALVATQPETTGGAS